MPAKDVFRRHFIMTFIKFFNALILAFACLTIVQAGINTKPDTDSYEFNPSAIVAIKVEGQNGFCSGVIISAHEIMTAAHCVYDLKHAKYFSHNRIYFGIGENLAEQSFQWLPVNSISKKSSTVFEGAEDFISNDIVILSIKLPIHINPIRTNKTLKNNSILHAWGYGEDQWGYFGIRKSRPLKEVNYDANHIVFTSGACRGDSGGPVLNQHYELVGIISISEERHCVNEGRRIAQKVR